MRKYEVIVSQFSERDIDEIINYFIDINKDYSISLYKKLKKRIIELETFPEKGRMVPELEQKGITAYKEIVEGNYRIIYSIHKASVYILAVIDSRRNLEEILLKKVIDFF
jgi:toxin ParE1/3/4